MRPISLAAGVMPEFAPDVTATAAAAAGFDMSGVWVDLEQWSPALMTAVRRTLAGLPVLDVEYIRIGPGPLGDDPRKVIEIGGELGAGNVLVISVDPDHGATAAKLAEIAEIADAHGMRAAFEFGIFTTVRTLDAALAIVEAATHPAVSLLLDPIHLDRAGVAPADLTIIPPERLSYAQFCDARADRPDPADTAMVLRDALDLRELPGAGALPLTDFLAALPPGLPLSVELRSAALRAAFPDPVERAAAVAGATRSWLARAR